MASAKVASRYSWRAFSASGPLLFATLRNSYASSVVSPRTLSFHLFPRQVGEVLRNPHALHEVVSHIDEELEGDGEAVFHQAGGDEDALRIAQRLVAMADGAVGQLHVVAVGDHGLVAHVQGERHKVVGLAIQSRRNRPRHGSHHALQIGEPAVTSPSTA